MINMIFLKNKKNKKIKIKKNNNIIATALRELSKN